MSLLLLLSIAWTFPHAVHIENGVECLVCHEGATTSVRSSDVLLPQERACLDCHESSMEYKKKEEVALIARFPHKIHAGVGCTTCHMDPRSPKLPIMENCSSCHNGSRASKDCYTCHEKGESRLLEYHAPRWKNLHGEEARISEKDCLLCHRLSQGLQASYPSPACENCHTRENLSLEMHPENFLYQHPQAFSSREEDCGSCHENLVDCRSCHRERGIYPMNHNLPRWLTFTGGEHEEEAKADPERCLVCHGGEEPICAKCHGGG